MSESVFIGDIGEQIAICMFVKSGFTVSKPITNNSRYDLIVDINNKLYKVQVKTTENIKNNIMSFATKTTNYTKGKWKSKSYKIDDIDFFFLYCMENNWCGLYIPKGKIFTEISIRIDKPKNNQKKGIRLADDYNFERQISILLKEES